MPVAPQTVPDLSKPSLAGLAWLLRQPEEWPGHHWDFSVRLLTKDSPSWAAHSPVEGFPDHCGTTGCAMGLCDLRWGGGAFAVLEKEHDAGPFGPDYLLDHPFDLIFRSADTYGVAWEDVTPTMVADKIDAYIAGRE